MKTREEFYVWLANNVKEFCGIKTPPTFDEAYDYLTTPPYSRLDKVREALEIISNDTTFKEGDSAFQIIIIARQALALLDSIDPPTTEDKSGGMNDRSTIK